MLHLRTFLSLLLVSSLIAPSAVQAGFKITTSNQTVDSIAQSDEEVVHIGTKRDPQSGGMVDGFAIIHHRDFPSHRSEEVKVPGDSEKCFKVISKKARWKTIEPWVVNTSNTQGIASEEVFAVVNQGVQTWEAAANGVDIFGPGATTNDVLEGDTVAPDGKNEVMFGTLSRRNVLGITFIWGYFRGSSSRREIIEWDQVYNQGDYAWTTTGESGKMDFGTVSLHELGHAVGLDDLYKSKCSGVAMFGHAEVGVTVKRSLGIGDKAGVKSLYNMD
jgi:hypothetical protein